MHLTRRRLLGSAAAMGVAPSCLGDARAATPDAELDRLFDGLVEALLQDSPESATFLGLDKGARKPEVAPVRPVLGPSGLRSQDVRGLAGQAQRHP